MTINWLHISDFHFSGGDQYDREVVLRALLKSVRNYRIGGHRLDLIFATGDVANFGKEAEYEAATKFFDSLIDAAGVEKRRLFIIPGNHDVDRDQGTGLARTLDSREQADRYFKPVTPKPHIVYKQEAFLRWHNRYFETIRKMPNDSTCGPVEAVEVDGTMIAVLPINSALFCEDDHDHGKLWVGRRCLDRALAELESFHASLNVALVHHPLDWLNSIEGANIRSALASKVNFILRGHLHENDVERVAGVTGETLNFAAGAAYQTRKHPNRALYATINGNQATVRAVRYEDSPEEKWLPDVTLFSKAPDFEGKFEIPLLAATPQPSPRRQLRSNIPPRYVALVGREDRLENMLQILGDPVASNAIILRGPVGVGKTELAQEFARLHKDKYPGGTFILDATAGAIKVELARIGQNWFDTDIKANPGVDDQYLQTWRTLSAEPSLLIYDNASSEIGIRHLLPPGAMPCHVIITTIFDRWEEPLPCLDVEPLSEPSSMDLVVNLVGRELADRHGRQLVERAEGLPEQIVRECRFILHESRRGRGTAVKPNSNNKTAERFRNVYEKLESPVKLLLHAAARFTPQRIIRNEIKNHFSKAARWSEVEFDRRLDSCLDVYLLTKTEELHMHQLFASFLLITEPPGDVVETLKEIERSQSRRVVELAAGILESPNRTDLATALMTYPLDPARWGQPHADILIDEGEQLGLALLQIRQFGPARPWFERAILHKENNQSAADRQSLGQSLHSLADCIAGGGGLEDALPWFARAAEVKAEGDVYGRINHASRGESLHSVGRCLRGIGDSMNALRSFRDAVSAKQQGDFFKRIDHAQLGSSLSEMGFCMIDSNELDEAYSLFQSALSELKIGDIRGRVDHTDLGICLHQMGYCLSCTEKFTEARDLFDRAMAEFNMGDIHGRVDNIRLGQGMHQVGYCVAMLGQLADSIPWFERAVAAKEKGDIYGRIDHENLGVSLYLMGHYLSQQDNFIAALSCFERAAAEIRLGDVHGRIDEKNLKPSLVEGALCLRKLGRIDEALAWEQRLSQIR